MVTAPVPTPVTVDPLMDAMDGLLLVQVPPETVLLNVVDEPRHTLVAPVIAAGTGFTVTTMLEEQVVAVTE